MKLSKEKKQQIILVWLVAAGVIAGVWFLLIKTQKENRKKLETEITDAEKKYEDAKRLVDRRAAWETDYVEAEKRLKAIEATMASGDLNSWISKTLDDVKADHDVEIIQFSDPKEKEVELLPVFPYRAATYLVEGKAFYHDFGRFVADFENRLPYARVQNIDLSPASGTLPAEKEKLQFRMEIVALIKPKTSK